MFNLFGFRKDSKKPSTEKEVDGGFVIVGEYILVCRMFLVLTEVIAVTLSRDKSLHVKQE